MPINSINEAGVTVSSILIPVGGITALVGSIFLAAYFSPSSFLGPTTALYIGPPVLVLGIIIEGVGIALLVISLKKQRRRGPSKEASRPEARSLSLNEEASLPHPKSLPHSQPSSRSSFQGEESDPETVSSLTKSISSWEEDPASEKEVPTVKSIPTENEEKKEGASAEIDVLKPDKKTTIEETDKELSEDECAEASDANREKSLPHLEIPVYEELAVRKVAEDFLSIGNDDQYEHGIFRCDDILVPFLALAANDDDINNWATLRLVCRHWYHIINDLKLNQHSLYRVLLKNAVKKVNERLIHKHANRLMARLMSLNSPIGLMQASPVIRLRSLFKNRLELDSLLMIDKCPEDVISMLFKKTTLLFERNSCFRIIGDIEGITKGILFKISKKEKTNWVLMLAINIERGNDKRDDWRIIFGNETSIFNENWSKGDTRRWRDAILPGWVVDPDDSD